MSPRLLVVVPYVFYYLSGSQSLGSITYQIAPREGNKASWSLDGGTITTDGTIGDILPENFESWELRFTSPSGESKISKEEGSAILIAVNFIDSSLPGSVTETDPSLIATTDQLIADPGKNGILSLTFATEEISTGDFNGKAVVFLALPTTTVAAVNTDSSNGILVDNTVDSSNPLRPVQYDLIEDNPNGSFFNAPLGPLVIGTVASIPEPSTLLLSVVFLSHLLCRRRVVARPGA